MIRVERGQGDRHPFHLVMPAFAVGGRLGDPEIRVKLLACDAKKLLAQLFTVVLDETELVCEREDYDE